MNLQATESKHLWNTSHKPKITMGISLSQSANQVEMFYIQSLTFLILLTLSSLCGQVSIQVLTYIEEAEKNNEI